MKTVLAMMTLAAAVFSAAPAYATTDAGEGEVRKIDAGARRIIIRHGDWEKGNMSAMTMAMQVREGVRLDAVRKGDQVRFAVAREGGDWVVTQIQPAGR